MEAEEKKNSGTLTENDRKIRPWYWWLAGASIMLGSSEILLELGLSHATGITPDVLRIGALFAGAVLAARKHLIILASLSSASAILFALISWTPIVESPIRSLLREDKDTKVPDAIVVYSGSMTDAGNIGDVALTRLVAALTDAKRLGVENIVLSEQFKSVKGKSVGTSADQLQIASLITPINVHFVNDVSNTHEESVKFARLSSDFGWTHLRATTSPLHAKRACLSLEATGIQVTCSPSIARDVSFQHLDTPEARRIATRAAVHEIVGLLVYKWRGWI